MNLKNDSEFDSEKREKSIESDWVEKKARIILVKFRWRLQL